MLLQEKSVSTNHHSEHEQRSRLEYTTMIPCPGKTGKLSYLVPMSEFNSEPYVLKAYVDYNEARHARNGKLKVTMSLMPELYRNASMTPDSVEYIIEPKRAQ